MTDGPHPGPAVEAARGAARLARPARVLCLNPMLDPDGEARLEAAGAELIRVASADRAAVEAALPAADAVVVRLPAAMSAADIALAARARVVACSGSGADHIDVAAASAAGLPVVNNPQVGARAVAEHALGLMLALLKRIPRGDRLLRTEGWAVRERFHHEEMSDDLFGRALGLVGYGPIAREIARICETGFDMRVHVFSRSRPADLPAGREWTGDLEALCARADVLSVNAPLTPATRGLVGRAALARLGPRAVVINTSRGALIDEAALAEALREGRIAGAALDVFEAEPLPREAPILAAPNLIATPHVAGLSRSACRRLALSAADQVVQALNGERPPGLVNPEIWPSRRS